MFRFRFDLWDLHIPWPPNTTLETVHGAVQYWIYAPAGISMGQTWATHDETIHFWNESFRLATWLQATGMIWRSGSTWINPQKKWGQDGPRCAKMRQATGTTSTTGVTVTSTTSDRMGFEVWWTATATSARRFGSPSIVADQDMGWWWMMHIYVWGGHMAPFFRDW